MFLLITNNAALNMYFDAYIYADLGEKLLGHRVCICSTLAGNASFPSGSEHLNDI